MIYNMGLLEDLNSGKYNLYYFFINIGAYLNPQGKAVRIFSWANQPDNDKYYGPGVHYIKDLHLPIRWFSWNVGWFRC
jgi:hypothetical protein